MEPQRILKPVRLDRALELIAAFAVITGLIGLIATLAECFFAPQVLLGGLLLTGGYALKTRGHGVLPGMSPRWRHVILLLLIALFFRLPVYHYILGDQDEGLYVNIAHYIDRSGGIEAHDEVRQRLIDSPYLQRYMEDNRVGEYNAAYLAGVYARNSNSSKVEFQFYDLFPVWMALFGGLFGATFGVYALTFFALLSVLFFYRLALLLTRSYHAALAAGGLLALNPLHAFFSKFPVTEVPTLAFSLMGFTLLAGYWSAPPGDRQGRWLVLSVLSFLCLFTTRISGFMYVPFFIALATVTLVCDRDAIRRRAIQRWAIGVTGAYLISVMYGLIWSHSYSHDIYLLAFEPLLGTHWKTVIAAIVAAVVVLWIIVALLARDSERRGRWAHRVAGAAGWLPGIIVLVALMLGLWKIYRLGWTDRYVGDPWLADTWQLAKAGWVSATASSLWTLAVYLGPLLVLAFLALIGRRQPDARLNFLRWFVAGFFAYVALLQWTIPYGPYYARYLLSELAPYLILLVVCAWAGMRVGTGRAAVSAALFLSVLYAATLSVAQIGKNEDDGAYAALGRLIAPIEADDLILLNTLDQNGPDPSVLKTPLLYTFGRNVVTIGDVGLANTGYLAQLNSLYDDLFLVSPDPRPPKGFALIDSVRFKVLQFEPTHFFPRRLSTKQDVLLYLFRLAEPQFPLEFIQPFTQGSPWMGWLRSGWGAPEEWGVWSSGKHATLSINPRALPQGHTLMLQIDARAYVAANHPQQRIDVSVEGKIIGHYRAMYPAGNLTMQIPLDEKLIASGQRILVDFSLPDAASPTSLGNGNDLRQLAIGLVDASVAIAPAAMPSLPAPSASIGANPRH